MAQGQAPEREVGNVGLLCRMEWAQDDPKHSRQSGQRCLVFGSGGETDKGEISNIKKQTETEMGK